MLKNIRRIAASEIVVDRDNRQRRELKDIPELKESIERLGVLQPIVIDAYNRLIAGERRLTACREIDPEYKVPYVLYDNLDDRTQAIVELEENLKRTNLHWQDHCLAVYKIHHLLIESGMSKSLSSTATYIGMTDSNVSRLVSVAEALLAGDARILKSDGISAAHNILRREQERARGNELNELMDVITDHEIRMEKGDTSDDEEDYTPNIQAGISPSVTAARSPQSSANAKADIVQGNFIEFCKEYDGKRFNFLHCDFPYGVGHGNSAQGGTASGRWEGYQDSEDVYWELCSALCSNLDKLLYPSAHVMFWFSMEYYMETIAFFNKHAPSLDIQAHPLIWHKTDNKGIVKDVERRPRNVYEAALIMSRGDRKIIQPVANVYGAPTRKEIHVSEKPEPVLRHFFRMFVDHYSEVLDPTAGSGTAIRVAACDRGAKRALGLELNPDFAAEAKTALVRKIGMEALSSSIGLKGETTDGYSDEEE